MCKTSSTVKEAFSAPAFHKYPAFVHHDQAAAVFDRVTQVVRDHHRGQMLFPDDLSVRTIIVSAVWIEGRRVLIQNEKVDRVSVAMIRATA